MSENARGSENDGDSEDWSAQATARNLQRVVPISQKQDGEATLALSVMELYGNGHGLLRYLLSYEAAEEGTYEGSPDPETAVFIGPDRHLEVGLVAFNAVAGEAQGLLHVTGLPDSGHLKVEIVRIHFRDFRGARDAALRRPLEGPWIFGFSF